MGAEEFLNIEEHKREFSELLQYCLASGRIDQNLYQEYDVKRGLRDSSGKGVLTGLTEISDVLSYKSVNGKTLLVMLTKTEERSLQTDSYIFRDIT